MKKIICLLVGLLMFAGAFCQEAEEQKAETVTEAAAETKTEKVSEAPTESVKPQIEFLLRHNYNSNKAKISELSTYLTTNEKIELYETFETKPIWPVLFNVGAGFGIGSYIVGDKKGGIIGTCLDVAAGLILIGSYGKYTEDLFEWEQRTSTFKSEHPQPELDNYTTLPVLLIIGARVIEGISVNKYVKKMNQELSDLLGFNGLATNIVPVLTSDGNLAVAFNIGFTK